MRRDRGVVLPAGAVIRVERVDGDVARPLVAHGRGRRPRPEDRLAAVEQPAEQSLGRAPVRPVPVDLEPRELAAPVRDVELDAALLRRPRREAPHRQVPLPRLQRPVRPVGRLAADDEERQRRAVVAAAAVAERAPVVRVLAALPAAGVVHLEPRLNGGRARLVGIPSIAPQTRTWRRRPAAVVYSTSAIPRAFTFKVGSRTLRSPKMALLALPGRQSASAQPSRPIRLFSVITPSGLTSGANSSHGPGRTGRARRDRRRRTRSRRRGSSSP